MKIFGKYLLMSAIALGLWSCSDDAPEVNSPDEPVDELYMSVRIQLPTSGGSRSETTEPGNASNDGTEVGFDRENNVSRVLLILADSENNSFIAAKTITSPQKNGANVTAQGTFNKSILLNYIDSKPTTSNNYGKVKVYAFCNPTSEQETYFTGISRGVPASVWAEQIHTIQTAKYEWGSKDNEIIWRDDNFLMANDDIYSLTLPTKSNIEAGLYNTKEKAFDLTNGSPIKVQRSVARFDFKDGSGNNCTYTFANNDEGKTTLKVQLTKMSLVNLSKSFFHLIRTSKTGLNSDFTLCGKDMYTIFDPANSNIPSDNDNWWVVDTDAELKNGVHADAYKNFFFWSGDGRSNTITTDGTTKEAYPNWKPAEWDTYDIATQVLVNGHEHNFNGWKPTHEKRDGYYIWRYATENTIPKQAVNQKNGITTGIIFRGELTYDATTSVAPELKAAMDAGNTLYAFNRIIYGDWETVKAFAQANADKAAYTDFVAAVKACNDDPSKAVANGFTVYESENIGTPSAPKYVYPMYYPYWNRHNDNGNNSMMGHMEFQVVRNNIYKLCVTAINGLGHPTKPGNDPDPFNPENPDEKEDVFFEVDVQVLNWVVRVNDITFP